MADDTTKLVISLDLILRNLQATLKGLSQVEKQLKSVSSVKFGGQANFDKAAAAAQKLQLQQQKLSIQAQELANREERARQTTERLAQARERLSQATSQEAATAQRAANEIARINAATARQAQQQEALRTKAAKTIADVQVREAQRGADTLIRTLQQQSDAANVFSEHLRTVGGSLRSIGQGMASLGAALTIGLTGPLVAIGAASLKASVTLDSLKLGLTAITGSSREAGVQLARLTELAKLPGIGFEEAIQGSIRLQAVGFSAQDAEKALRQFANAIALTGGGRAELERVTIQLGQLAAKGKVLSQDLRPIIEAAPAVGTALKRAFGTVNADDIAQLTENSKEFLDILTTELEKLPRAAGGARNAFENFRDTIFRASTAIGDALLPVLTRFIEVASPVIIRLAEAFRALPRPLQTTIVFFGAFAAALGPTLFLVGQFATGIGRLAVGLAALDFRAIINGLRGFVSVASAAIEAQTGLAASTALLSTALLGIGAAIGIALIAYGAYRASQREVVKLSAEQLAAQDEVINGLQEQIKFVSALNPAVKRTAEEQERLTEVYQLLNLQAQTRLTGITDEEKRLAALRAELENLLHVKQQEQVQGAANLAGSLANTLAQVRANEQEIESNVRRVQANAELADSIRRTNTISAEQSRQLARQGINASTVEEALGALQAESEALVNTNQDLRESTNGLNGTAKEQVATLEILERQTGLNARQLLLAAKNMGVFRGDVEQTLEILKLYTQQTVDATNATRDFNSVLKEQSGDLIKAGDAAEEAEKRRQKLISSAAALAREASTSFDGALKFFRAFIAANPELTEAVRKQAQVQQKTVDEFLRQVLGGSGRSGTALRNAQEQLQKAITSLVKAEGDKQVSEEEAKNERLLQANEAAFKQQLISYREFIQARAVLTDSSIQREVEAQQALVVEAEKNRARLLKQAQDKSLPAAERVKRQAQATEEQAKSIEAQRKVVELQSKQKTISEELKTALAEAAVQQREDVRKLEIEYAKLTDRIEESLNAATDEKFRLTLLGLVQTQRKLNEELAKAKAVKDADAIAGIEAAKALNQRQIDVINNTITEERALNRLTATEEIISRAKQEQSDLEKQIAFDVEFRGLRETEAIRRRLEGERKLQQSLEAAKNTVQQTIDALTALGLKPPQALIDFVRETQLAMKGLGELSFTDQFALAEKEFNRIQDELANKIAQVELAVRHRDLAEIQGRILIKKLNGEYVADLERQAEILADIAAKSGQQGLQKQAADAQQTAREVKAATTEVADFNAALKSVSIDALQQGFEDFFASLTDRTKTAKEKLLDLVNSVAQSIERFIAKRLSEQLIESIFGTPQQQAAGTGGLIAGIKRLFGLGGGQGATGGTGDVLAGAAASIGGAGVATGAGALTAAATTAGVALVTGGTSAGTAMTSGAVAFTTAVTAAGASFATAVAAAAAAFAAAIAGSAGAQAFSGLAGGAGQILAATGMFPAVPGGLVRVVEGGFPEAVLTTDPKHAARQVGILREFLARTKGLFGRIPGFDTGGFISARDVELSMLSSINRNGLPSPPATTLSGPARQRNLRFIFVDDQRDVRNWMDSAEGDTVFVEKLHRNRHVIRRLT